MKDNKKKILAAAAFLIAAGLVFGMSKKENGIRELDDSGAVVMSGSMQELMGSEGKRDAEKNTKLSTDSSIPDGEKNPQTESESGVGESREAGNETGTGKSPSETQVEVDNSKAAGIYVYICGEVANPGVYELSEDSRIYEAVDAAGGFTENAARESINLASKVSDGMQITIYNKEEAASLSAGGTSAGKNSGQDQVSGSSSLVNLNTATKEELMTLKGIGESKAEDIIRYREKSGGFKKIEDIMKISGIKEAGFQKIKDSITV